MGDPIVSTKLAAGTATASWPRLAGNRFNWSTLTVVVTLLIVVALIGITGAVSYDHEYTLASHHRQPGWVSSLLPFTVDGIIAGASIVIFWAASHGIRGWRQLWRPLAILLVGIGATIGANLAAGLGDGALGAAVSAWSGLAVIFISDLAYWLMTKLRSIAAGEPVQPEIACNCSAPATTLAGALVAARGELKRLGKPSGEQVLADLFSVSRHQVRIALAAPVAALEPGDGDGDLDGDPAGFASA